MSRVTRNYKQGHEVQKPAKSLGEGMRQGRTENYPCPASLADAMKQHGKRGKFVPRERLGRAMKQGG